MKKIFYHAFPGYVFPDGEYRVRVECCSQEKIQDDTSVLFLQLRIEGLSYDGKNEVSHIYEEFFVIDHANRRFRDFCHFLEISGVFVTDCRHLKGLAFKAKFSKVFVGYTALPIVKYLALIEPPLQVIPREKLKHQDWQPPFPYEIYGEAVFDFEYSLFPVGEYIFRIAESWIEEISEGVNGIFFKAFCYEKSKNFDEGIHMWCFIIIDKPDIPQRNDFFSFLENNGIDFYEYDTLFGMEFEADLRRKDFGGIILPDIKFGQLLALPLH